MSKFELWLFTTDRELACCATAAGVDGFVIDWEWRGKRERQWGADTQVNQDTVEDLIRVRGATKARIIVRISQYGSATSGEIERAVDGGADEVLLPMVETEEEVERTMALAQGRVGMGILIETIAAVRHAERLGRLPLRRVFVGLNDLAIQRGTRCIFVPLIDGTLERIAGQMRVPLGFGGLTLPEGGSPIPCRLLMGEMARLQASFSFLRRSFIKDVPGRDMKEAVIRIRAALTAAGSRGAGEVAAERNMLVEAVNKAVLEAGLKTYEPECARV